MKHSGIKAKSNKLGNRSFVYPYYMTSLGKKSQSGLVHAPTFCSALMQHDGWKQLLDKINGGIKQV
jgi:hypothetical protein